MESEREWLTAAQLAEWLQVPERALEGWRYRGTGPLYHRLGHRTIRYRKRDVEKWLAGQASWIDVPVINKREPIRLVNPAGR